MYNYSQQNQMGYYPNPHFPEPPKKSWFGILLLVLGTALAGFFLGQSVKIGRKDDEYLEPHEVTNHQASNIIEETKEQTVNPHLKISEPPKDDTEFKQFEDLDDDVIDRFISDFEEINQAEKLWCKRQFEDNPHLIEMYPELATLLGLEPTETDNQL